MMSAGSATGMSQMGAPAVPQLPSAAENKELFALIVQLQSTNPETRETALFELSKKRESFPDLAPTLWYSFGTIAALLQEIVSLYPMLSPPTLTPQASNRVCNALALLQCVASHNDTKNKLVKALIPLYLYPFLNTVSRHRPFEYLRLTSLGVIGALVKIDDTEIVSFLLQTEIIPLCLRIMETGTELSKTVATFIVQKILLDDAGLTYVCATGERFYAVSSVLSSMVLKLTETPSARLLKHIVRCYLRLSENQKAREALKQCLPDILKDPNFGSQFVGEESVQRWMALLLKNVNEPSTATNTASGAAPSAASAGSAATLGGVGPPPGVASPPTLSTGVAASPMVPPSLPKPTGPPGVALPNALSYANTFKREGGAGWNT